ncbi:TIGR04222 domain-containing membrane protein [Streptomyces sp. NPDC058045]|uniref:TIGR04222 domain-containing membrane protein n=1 Tax=Streptomyces sp. NPDC058045 TaxID=3346311 RepID=UPI0036EDF95A
MISVILLLGACAAAGLSCARLCLAASRAADEDRTPAAPRPEPGRGALTVYETAFLSGGPRRVAEVALVSMAQERRLLLAHTGWATVVDPCGRDEWERSVLSAIGPGGQSRIAPVRSATAGADTVRALADRLAAAGLATPPGARTTFAGAAAQVRAASLAVVGFAALALSLPQTGPMVPGGYGLLAVWFALPLVLTLSCLLIARVEARPGTRWASPAGRRLLAAGPPPEGRSPWLTAVALRGVRAIPDPSLRAALAHRDS